MHGNVYLIGLMGAGKTTVGRKLAGLLHFDFIDTDQSLEKRTGVSVNHIFEVEGEQGFRDRESILLAEVSARSSAVISTGGGIILRENNRIVMRKSGTVIYLRASLELLWNRIKGCQTRPLLSTPDPKGKISELLDERDPLYSNEADLVVDVGAETATSMARKIHVLLMDNENG